MSIELFEEYYRKDYNNLVARMKARGFQEADAEDIVQEASLRALRYIDCMNEPAPWFSMILNNSARDYYHALRTGDFSFSEEIYDEDEGTISLTESREHEEMLSSIAGMIESCSEGHADILKLHLLQGYTTKEVSQILDEKENTVKSIVHRFKNKLGEEYERSELSQS